MNQNNAVVLIAAHNTKALSFFSFFSFFFVEFIVLVLYILFSDYLYPSRSNIVEKTNSPWEKYEQIGDIDEQIRENLKRLANEQLNKMSTTSRF